MSGYVTSEFTPPITTSNIINRPIRLPLPSSIDTVRAVVAELKQRARKLHAAAFCIHVVISCK